MKKFLSNITIVDSVSILLLVTTTITLFITGFFIPPPGVIDSSVITAGGVLSGVITVLKTGNTIDKAIEKSKGNIKISTPNTNIDLDNGSN